VNCSYERNDLQCKSHCPGADMESAPYGARVHCWKQHNVGRGFTPAAYSTKNSGIKALPYNKKGEGQDPPLRYYNFSSFSAFSWVIMDSSESVRRREFSSFISIFGVCQGVSVPNRIRSAPCFSRMVSAKYLGMVP